MKTLLIYDIPEDRLRSRVADICLDYGLRRIQYSAFFGDVSRNRQEEIIRKVRNKAGKKPISLHLFPICEKDLASMISVLTLPPADPFVIVEVVDAP
jgi:CRISPR-associated protein Cas2